MERRKTRVGKVVSDKMDKTVVVAVETRRHSNM
jgi:ribosomal protein S17